MRSIAFALLLAAVSSSAAVEPKPDTAAADIDRFVAKVLREIPDVPAAGVAVTQNGRTVYLHDAQTGYYIGSTTKAYTGLACAILAERGRLDLDAPITKYLPEVHMAPPLDASKITLRKFLTHTSGIVNDPIVFRTAFSGEHTPAMIVSLLNDSKPGVQGFRYDNLGYVVASVVIERVTGKPWQKALDDLVFTPLGMHHTSAYMSEAQRWPMAKGYTVDDRAQLIVSPLSKNDRLMHAAGGIVTTPADLARWLQANLTKGRVGTKQVIPAAAFEEAQRLQVEVPPDRAPGGSKGYGFGWYQASFGTHGILIHQGGYEGWRSLFSFMPETQIGVGVMINTSGPGASAAQLILSYVYDRLLDTPDLEATYAKRLDEAKAAIAKSKADYLADIARRAQRQWTLQHPRESYTGAYANRIYGTIHITQSGDALIASLADLKATMTPYPDADSGRVELVPGLGEVIRFSIGPDGHADSLTWREARFPRVTR